MPGVDAAAKLQSGNGGLGRQAGGKPDAIFGFALMDFRASVLG